MGWHARPTGARPCHQDLYRRTHGMIGYTTLGTNDLPRATAFYDALFKSVDIHRIMELPTIAAWGTSWTKPIFGIAKPYDGKPATVGNGTMVALGMRTREKVRRVHARALELGGSDEGESGVRGIEGSQAFYACYFRDLDGNKLCFFRVGSSDEEKTVPVRAA